MTDESDPSAPARPEPATAGPTPEAPATPSSSVPGPHRPSGSIVPQPVQYKGQPLEPDRGPGLGCFRFQLVLLVVLILVTPLSVGRVPDIVTAGLLFLTIALLLVSGQTIIFLLRLVAADRRGRRQPLAPRSPTVGQLEDEPGRPAEAAGPPVGADDGPSASREAPAVADGPSSDPASSRPDEPSPPSTGPVRQ